MKMDTRIEIHNLVQSLLSRNGKFQIFLIFILSINSIIVGINHTITVFHTYTPKFFCLDNKNFTCGVYINGSECPSGYSFDQNDDTTVTVEFQTVCGRSMLGPLVNSLYFVGVTLGSLICSALSDKYGRRTLVVVCLYGQALAAVGEYYFKSFEIFVTFRLIQGFFIQGLQTSSYTLIMEFCPQHLRTISAVYWESNWAIGLMVLGVVAYFVHEWRLLTLLLALPTLLTLSYIWVIPESIIWLETKGKIEEAFISVKKLALWNKRTDIMEQCKQIRLRGINKEEISMNKEIESGTFDQHSGSNINISVIFKNRILSKHIFSMICIWFSVTLSYYGVLYYLPNLAGQRHLNFEIGALIELISYILAYFVFSSFGRKIPMALYQYGNGLLIFLLALLTCTSDMAFNRYLIVGISLIAKGLAVSSFCGMFIYCSELLPTLCRGVGLGICGCSARFASLLAPQLMSLVTILPSYVPLVVMSALLLFTGSLTLILPETVENILPNTIEDAEKLWGQK